MRLGRLLDAGDARISAPLAITTGRVSFQNDKEGSGTDRLCQLLSFSALARQSESVRSKNRKSEINRSDLTMSVYPAQNESHIFVCSFAILFWHGGQAVGGVDWYWRRFNLG
jgi:hypothetical protein